jgi:hypothetical protein
MGVREAINKKPVLTNAVVVPITILALAAIVMEIWPKPPGKFIDEFYFTDDGGKTYYPDGMANLPPYTHNGGEAVIAHVFQCGSNPPFIAYMEKLTPDMLDRMKSADPPDDDTPGTLVKRPGDTDWVLIKSAQGHRVTALTPPSGETGAILPVIPGVDGVPL